MAGERKYDLLVWGATGFTGGLVCEYLAERYGSNKDLKFAIGGRSRSKLEESRANAAKYNADWKNVDIVVADSDNMEQLNSLTRSTRVLITTVGPFVTYGSGLVDACVRNGTHYCDITGEVQWVRSMIERHHDAAKAKGVKIVNFCGFDSVPSDMGAFLVAEQFKTVIGNPPTRIKAVFGPLKGSVSGGTLNSMQLFMKDAPRIIRDRFFLNPDDRRSGSAPADRKMFSYESDIGRWTIPFFMALCNTRVVRRAIALRRETYSYDEAMVVPGGFIGAFIGWLVLAFVMVILRVTKPISHWFLPKAGTGPSRHVLESGMFQTRVYGFGESPQHSPRVVCCKIEGKGDPGYRLASRMIAEAALCLAFREDQQFSKEGGVLTPSTALGSPYIERLNNAGIVFSIHQEDK